MTDEKIVKQFSASDDDGNTHFITCYQEVTGLLFGVRKPVENGPVRYSNQYGEHLNKNNDGTFTLQKSGMVIYPDDL
jgi:hypothetical protein